MTEPMVAVCGLTCSNCLAFIATQAGDDEALVKVAARWSEEYGGQLSAEDCSCNGCLSPAGPWMSHCSECKIRACGVEKAADNCALCSAYACDKLTEFLEFVPEAKQTLEAIRAAR